MFRGKNALRKSVAGQLVIFALIISLISSMSGPLSYRYFVASLALMAVAVIVLMDARISKATVTAYTIGVLALFVLWSPSFPASDLRSSPAPAWSEELARAVNNCQLENPKLVVLRLTPAWPPDESDWTLRNQPRVACELLDREILDQSSRILDREN